MSSDSSENSNKSTSTHVDESSDDQVKISEINGKEGNDATSLSKSQALPNVNGKHSSTLVGQTMVLGTGVKGSKPSLKIKISLRKPDSETKKDDRCRGQVDTPCESNIRTSPNKDILMSGSTSDTREETYEEGLNTKNNFSTDNSRKAGKTEIIETVGSLESSVMQNNSELKGDIKVNQNVNCLQLKGNNSKLNDVDFMMNLECDKVESNDRNFNGKESDSKTTDESLDADIRDEESERCTGRQSRGNLKSGCNKRISNRVDICNESITTKNEGDRKEYKKDQAPCNNAMEIKDDQMASDIIDTHMGDKLAEDTRALNTLINRETKIDENNEKSGLATKFGDSGVARLLAAGTGSVNSLGIKLATGTTSTTSFLEALSVEERRVRTRHLPDVIGFRKLHKNEIKRDLALVRSLLKVGTSSSTFKSRKRKFGLTDERLINEKQVCPHDTEIDDDEAAQGLEDETETTSDTSISNGRSCIHVHSGFEAFSLPHHENIFECSGVDGKSGVMPAKQATSSDGQFSLIRSPHVVESITAFNPPRPPESVGPKKKHRLLRWEHRHQDVEVDLTKYRKTVQRTRHELQKVQQERERIESVGSHIRSHFLTQLKSMSQESVSLDHFLSLSQVDCVKASSLLISKTRSGGGKGTYAMRDVISVLKSRGSKLNLSEDYKDAGNGYNIDTWCSPGIGGISCIKSGNNSVASGWILPGDHVATPYGHGTVSDIFGPSELDPDEPPKQTYLKSQQSTYVKSSSFSSPFGSLKSNIRSDQGQTIQRHGFGVINGESSSAFMAKSQSTLVSKNVKAKKINQQQKSTLEGVSLIPPRMCVLLPYGIGYFQPSTLLLQESSVNYSDKKMAIRWKCMYESAKLMGTSLDEYSIGNMSSMQDGSIPISSLDVIGKKLNGEDDTKDGITKDSQLSGDENNECNNKKNEGKKSNALLSTDDKKINKERKSDSDSVKSKPMGGKRALPYGSSLIPTPGLPGGDLSRYPISLVEKLLGSNLDNLVGPMRTNNSIFNKWEEERCERYTLKGNTLQLRNDVYRQRRIRNLNERSFSSSKERSDRSKCLLAEMKADLNSLKERLNDELFELGIDQEKAEELLANHYKHEQEELESFHLPSKRKNEEYDMISYNDFDDTQPSNNMAIEEIENSNNINIDSENRKRSRYHENDEMDELRLLDANDSHLMTRRKIVVKN